MYNVLVKNKSYIIILAIIFVIGVFFILNNETQQQTRNKPIKASEFKNFILLGWDGVQREHLHELLDEGKLPNLEKLITSGSMTDIDISTGTTQTKPGWAEILTGYTPEITGVYSNLGYKPIPKGYTIFERLESYFGKDNIVTLFVGGKNNNINARGPHKICTNCLTRYPDTREKTEYQKENTSAPTRIPGEERVFEERDGEPYYYTKDALDVYLVNLGSAEKVGPKVIDYIEEYKDRRFFAFFQFEEPDQIGHFYGENSKEYSDGIRTDDYWLGEIVNKLKESGIYDETLIYVTSDHGFDEGGIVHRDAPYVFLATNDPKITANKGDRKDITPTILHRYGININSMTPPLYGVSLAQNEAPDVTFVIRQFLSDGPAMIADELGYYAEEGLNVRTIIVEKGEYAAPIFLSGVAQLAILGNKWSLLSQLRDINNDTEIIADLGGGGGRWRVMARKDSGITTLQDLDGKKFGSWRDSYGYTRFRSYLAEKDISITSIPLRGMYPEKVAQTLAEGNVDAVLVWEPIPSLIEENNVGYQIFTMEEIGNEMSIYLHAQKDFAQNNPGAVQIIFKALERAQRFIRDNPEEAARIISSRRDRLNAPTSAVLEGLSRIDFDVRFDETEKEEIYYTVGIFQEMGLHNLPDEEFIELNGEYIKQYENP